MCSKTRKSIQAFTLIEALVAALLLAAVGTALLSSLSCIQKYNGFITNQSVAIRKLNNAVNYYQSTGLTNYPTAMDPTGYSLASTNEVYSVTASISSMPYMQRSVWQQEYSANSGDETQGSNVTNSVTAVVPQE